MTYIYGHTSCAALILIPNKKQTIFAFYQELVLARAAQNIKSAFVKEALQKDRRSMLYRYDLSTEINF